MGGRWVLWLPRGSPTRHAEFSQTGELGICCFRHAAPVMPVRQGISGVADRVVSAGDRLPDKPENCPARPRGLFDMVPPHAASSNMADWATPGILEALIPGRMQGHGGTEEVPG